MPFVGFILIAMGLFSVGSVLYMVMHEKPEHEEWYDPAADKTLHPSPSTGPSSTTVAEVVGTQMTSPSPVIDAEDKRQADESQS